MRYLICTFVILFIFLSSGVAGAAPKLELESTIFDFGEVYQGDNVRHVFTFVNTGENVLLIDKVSSSCGCTAVLVSEKTLPPGAKGEIQANFDSTRFRGAVKKTIYLYSNDPVRPVQQLHIKGTVVEIVAVRPARVNFGRVSPDQSLAATITLQNLGKEPLMLGTPTTTAKELTAEIAATSLQEGSETTVELLLTPKPGQNRFSGYVIIPAENTPQKQLRIPVYATME